MRYGRNLIYVISLKNTITSSFGCDVYVLKVCGAVTTYLVILLQFNYG